MKIKSSVLCILLVVTILVLVGCKTVEPLFYNEPIKVGYKEKYKFWQAYKFNSISKSARLIRSKLEESGGIIFYQYLIDSNGNAWDIRLLRTVPEGLITQNEFEKSQFVYTKFRATTDNSELQTVRVFERLVFSKKSKSMTIPPDDMNDDEVIKIFAEK